MAQKVNPLAVRLGVNRGADSCWFSDYYYATLLSQDLHLREYLLTVTNRAAGTPIEEESFKPGRCVIHHYPKNSFVHFFFCLVKTTKGRRSVVPKRKPLYSYDSILPSLKHQTARWANALRVPREASLGRPRPALKHQHTGKAKSGRGGASTPGGATRNTHAGLKHTFVKHILAEVLLAEPGQPDVLSGERSPVGPSEATVRAKRGRSESEDWARLWLACPRPGARTLWCDEKPKPRLEPSSNQRSQRGALNHLSAKLSLQGDQPNPPQPGLLHKATSLARTTQSRPPTPQRPTGHALRALGLKLAKLVEARLHEVRCALAFHKALQTTTASQCSVVNERRSNLAFAPSSLRHKDAPQPRGVQLAGLLMNAAMRFHQGDPSLAHITPNQTQVLPGLLGTSCSSPGAAHHKGSELRRSGKPGGNTPAAHQADLWLDSSSPTLRAETRVRSTPLSEPEGGPYGHLYKKRQTRPSALRVVSSPSGFSPFNQAGAAAALVGELTTSSGNVPAPAAGGGLTQLITLRGGPWCLWWPESRLALRRISHLLSLFKVPTRPRLRTTRTTVAFYEQPQRLLGLWTKASPQAINRTAWDTSDKPPAGGGTVPLAASTVGGHPLTRKLRPEAAGFDHLASVCLTPALVKQLDTLGDWPSGLNTNTCATSSVALLGGLLLEEAEQNDGVTPEPFGVSSLQTTSTSAQVSSVLASTARVAQPYSGQTTTKSVWRPLVSTVHNRLTQQHGRAAVSPNPYGPMSNTPLGLLTQVLTCRMPGNVSPLTSDLHCRKATRRQHWLFRNQLCSPRPLATLTPSEASSAHQALCSNTGTKSQMLKLKRLWKPFVLESVPHFPKLMRLSGWTRLAMHQAQAWTMRHKTPKPLSPICASTQAPGDFPIPAAEPAVAPFNKKALAAGRRRGTQDRPDGTLAQKGPKAQGAEDRRAEGEPSPKDAGDAVLGTPSTAIDTAQGSLCQSTTKAQLLPKFGRNKGSTRSSWTLSPSLNQGLNHVVRPAAGEPSRKDVPANKHHQHVTPFRRNRRATGVFAVSADQKGWLTRSGLQYYVMHYFSLCKTNRSCGDVHGHVQHVQRHVKQALYLELPLNQSSHFLLSNIQSRIESHTGTFTSILPIKQSSVGYQTAYLVAQEISFKLEQKKSFRQICRSIFKQMDRCKYIIKGIRIKCSGRLNGAEMAKTECRKYGETSLHVFSEQIDYAHTKASTSFGILGVKVWIAYV